ncbi:hypothetical protein SUGI_0987750 [Cryptomeria japonica]|uniref:synaptotagmin-4 n=1 Tax=Cryptomeria japonica TaxID=3369 RepID=UPI0024149FF4|nr:synaptotagmin-4 [Cryptomeria japonica]GLJ46823.1 hypothetical protein SUGI_0987750 [Cryptomeria japonica]
MAGKIAALSKLTLEDSKLILPKESFPPWVVFSNRQKLSWLNFKLKKVWPFINEAASELIKEIIEPILEQYKPSILASLTFSTFTLGTVAPQFTGVKLVETTNSGAIMELEVQWDGDQNIVLDIRTLLGVTLPVQVKNIGFTGVFQLILQPLVNQLPCFGALIYSLLEKENLDFTLKVIGGDIKAIPGLAGAIEATIKDALEGSLMWPARNIIPILPGNYSELELRTVGILEVKLVQAKNLKNKEFLGKSDPFCVIYTRPLRDSLKKSKTINNQLNPVWNEHFELEVEDVSTQRLHIKVFDEEKVKGDKIMGYSSIKLKDLEPGDIKSLWLPLVKYFKDKRDTQYRGEVNVELRYCPLGMEAELTNSFKRKEYTLLDETFSMDMIGQVNSSLKYELSSKRHRIVRGVLSVTVKRAENLMPMDFLTKLSDPFVILKMQKSNTLKQTRVVPKTLEPTWDQTFHFVVEDALHDLLIAEVWDHDTFGKDFMGRSILTLSKLLLDGEYDADLTLDGIESGQLFLHLKWTRQQYYI